MTTGLSRAQLLSRSAKGGVGLWLAGSVAGSAAAPAAADPVPDGDLAYARLLVGTELLAADFYARALASPRLAAAEARLLRRVLAHEREHYRIVSAILRGAGQTPAVASDFDFSYPRRTFGSRASIAKIGVTLEGAALGAYLGAVDGVETGALRESAARIAASEAQHLSVLREFGHGNPIGASFPKPLAIEQASAVLDTFTS